MDHSILKIMRSMFVGLAIIAAVVMLPLYGQWKRYDAGAAQNFVLCDSSGRCASLETTGTVGVYALRTVGGSSGGGGGTVAQGAAGATAWPMTVSGALTFTSGTIGLITMPSLTVTSATIGQMPALSVTNSQTIGLITMPSLTFTSGTVGNTLTAGLTNTTTSNTLAVRCVDATGTAFVACGPTTVTIGQNAAPTGTTTIAGTLTGVTGTMAVTESGAWAVTASIAAGTNNIGTVGLNGAIPSGTNSIGTVGITGAINVGTAPVINVGTAVGVGATAAAVPASAINSGARAGTADPTAVTDGQLVAIYADKYGRLVIASAPQDLWVKGRATLTATTASAVLAAVTGVKNAVRTICVSNTSTAATRLDILDGATLIHSFAWVATATTAESDRNPPCANFDPPWTSSAANTAINAQLATAVTDVRVAITGMTVH